MNIATWTDRNLERFGDHEALVFGARSWTSRTLQDQSAKLAQALVALGVRPGDRVVVVLPNCPELVVSFPAILRAGGVVVLVHAGATAAEIERIVIHADAAAIITGAGLVTRMPSADGSRVRIVAGGSVVGWQSFESLVETHEPLVDPVDRADDDLAQIAYTSGATGMPKGVVYTHATLTARLRYLGAQQPRNATAPTAFLAVLPMAHTFGMILLFYRFVLKTKLVCLLEFEPRTVLDAIARHRIDVALLVPSMCEALLASPELGRHDLSSLRGIAIGGAPVPASLADRMEAAFKLRPTVGYGMTELPGITFNAGSGKRGSVGRLIPGVAARIVDDHGADSPPGQPGEIWLKAPWMSGTYFRQSTDSATKLRDGWLQTGDLGYFDADRDLFIVGRSKELIIQGGNKVYPQEVIDVVSRLPGVVDCAVIGLPNEFLGEEVVACVVCSPGHALTSEAVITHCRAGLDPRKLPARIRFVDAIPKTELGKVQAHVLREQIERASAHAYETELRRTLRALASADRCNHMRVVIGARLRDLGLVGGDVDAHTPFERLGVDSLGAVELVDALRSELGVPLAPTLTFRYPSIHALAEHLVAELFGTTRSTDGSPLVTLNTAGNATPIFCIHPSGGQITAYLRLRALLGDDQPLYAIQSRALHTAQTEHASLRAMAVDYADLVRRACKLGPYILMGWSMGGVIAHEVAAELERRGERVALVAAIDSSARAEPTSELHRLALALVGAAYDLQAWSPPTPEVLYAKLRDAELRALLTSNADREDVLVWCEEHGVLPPQAISPDRFAATMRLYDHHLQLLEHHERAVITAPMRVWWASRALGDWSPHTRGGVRVDMLEASHFTVIASPHFEKIAAELGVAARGR